MAYRSPSGDADYSEVDDIGLTVLGYLAHKKLPPPLGPP